MSEIDILLSLGEMIEVWSFPDSKEVGVSYRNCEIKDGIFLKAIYGIGDTFEQACKDYLRQIHGKTLVFNACSKERKEIRVL